MPFYGKAYPIPLKQLEVTKNKVYDQCKIGALQELKGKIAFGVPKKNDTIQLMIDFRKLNTMLVQSDYPLPTIDGLIQSIMGFHFATGLDLNMGYLSMPLYKLLKVILMINMLFWLFEWQVLPQGVKPAMDIFQGHMTSLFSHLKRNAPEIYLDDMLHPCDISFGNHLKHLETMLKVLEKAVMQVYAKKSTWWATALEFLSFWVTGNGYQPLKSQVEAILAIAQPTNAKQVCKFIRCINFIKNHIPKQGEILEPITKLTKKGESFAWGRKQPLTRVNHVSLPKHQLSIFPVYRFKWYPTWRSPCIFLLVFFVNDEQMSW